MLSFYGRLQTLTDAYRRPSIGQILNLFQSLPNLGKNIIFIYVSSEIDKVLASRNLIRQQFLLVGNNFYQSSAGSFHKKVKGASALLHRLVKQGEAQRFHTLKIGLNSVGSKSYMVIGVAV